MDAISYGDLRDPDILGPTIIEDDATILDHENYNPKATINTRRLSHGNPLIPEHNLEVLWVRGIRV